MESNNNSPHPPPPCPTIALPTSSSSPPPSPSPSPSNHYSHSAILFSSALVQHLESHPTLRLPSTYIGVRRVRPTTLHLAGKRKQRLPDDDDDDDDAWVPNNVMGEDSPLKSGLGRADVPNDQAKAAKVTTNEGENNNKSNNNSSNNNPNPNPREIVYKVTNPDGTQRRMTTQEKKLLKYELAQAKHLERKGERHAQHQQGIKDAKAGRRERKRQKTLAWKEKKRLKQQEQNDGGGEVPQNDNEGIVNDGAQEQKKGEKKGEEQMVCKSAADNASTQSSIAGGNEECFFDEELAALRGLRRGIPPVMLTPAATCVALEGGVLLLQQSHTTRGSGRATAAPVTTVMDPILSAQWATQLQESMVPSETSRGKEDMRPMAYRLVPEVWKSLCPDSLWASSKEEGDEKGAAVVKREDGEAKNTPVDETNHGPQQTVLTKTTPPAIPSSKSGTTTHSQSPLTTLLLLRNPSPAYDSDASTIFRHLHQFSHLHIACGSLFGCDFLLYDGRREDRHSFAGLRVYSCSGGGDPSKGKTFPIPSAYDMAGFVRTMNTARKIALVATVVRDSRDNNKVARVAIVDLALEKVLTAMTHIRNGSTSKRRSEEDKASGLARR